MPVRFSLTELEAYLDEALPPDAMAQVEKALRSDESLAGQLADINGRRDAGVHSLGGVWRRARLSCPSREQLGSYLLDALPHDAADYVTFHLQTIGCRYCTANLADMRAQHDRSNTESDIRRRKYFQSSAGYLEGGKSSSSNS